MVGGLKRREKKVDEEIDEMNSADEYNKECLVSGGLFETIFSHRMRTRVYLGSQILV